MQLPADQDPFTLMASAAQHILSGVPEIELEWWADPVDEDGTPERRLTITMRGSDRNASIRAAADAAVRPASVPPESWVPDTPEGIT
jgi:hypothetical protein